MQDVFDSNCTRAINTELHCKEGKKGYKRCHSVMSSPLPRAHILVHILQTFKILT